MPLTTAQQQAIDALVYGTFDRLDTSPRMQGAYTLDQIYGGILPPSPPPVAPPSTYQGNSAQGNIRTTGGIAGQAQLPADYRPATAFPVAPYMPILDGVVDPITGQSHLTPQQVMANARAVPSSAVVKAEGRPPARVQSTGWSDPSIPKLLPLNADLTQVAQAPPAPPNPFGYQGGFVKSDNSRLLPGQPLAFVPQSPMPPSLKAIDVAAGAPPLPRPRPMFPSLTPPALPQAMPKSQTYAGMTQPPSLIPHADEKLLGQMNGLSQMGKSPLGGLLMMLMAGGNKAQPPAVVNGVPMMRAMNGQPSNFVADGYSYQNNEPGGGIYTVVTGQTALGS